MAPYYPIFADLKEKDCLVVGGGNVAYKKILSLLKFGARITVVSKNINDSICDLVDPDRNTPHPFSYNKEIESSYDDEAFKTNSGSIRLVKESYKPMHMLPTFETCFSCKNFLAPKNFSDCLIPTHQKTERSTVEKKWQDCSHRCDFFLVIAATNCAKTNQIVHENAISLKVLVNVVDDLKLSSIIMPSIVERFPVSIAISTGGSSPALARKIRTQIESNVPAAYGYLSSLLGKYRCHFKMLMQDMSNRLIKLELDARNPSSLDTKHLSRLFWDNLLDGPILDMVLSNNFAGAEKFVIHELDVVKKSIDSDDFPQSTIDYFYQARNECFEKTFIKSSSTDHEGKEDNDHTTLPQISVNQLSSKYLYQCSDIEINSMKQEIESEKMIEKGDFKYRYGHVYIVGAGPGCPDLLTFRAVQLMQKADVIVYDRLVSPEIVRLGRVDAKYVYVGKTPYGNKDSMSQADINNTLLKFALKGYNVCRLKGGDPLIFGRGGEEANFLYSYGIQLQIVPGVTSATACAAYSGIPLTHRTHSSCVRILTAHAQESGKPELPWVNLAEACANETIVIYMGLKNIHFICLQLLSHGASRQVGVAVISKGTTLQQKTVVGELENIARLVEINNLQPPAIIIIGNVVKSRLPTPWYKEDT